MELSTTREILCCLDTRQFPSILWNPKALYQIHKSSSPVPILSQTNQVQITPSHLHKIHPNIIQQPASWSSSWPPFLRLSRQQSKENVYSLAGSVPPPTHLTSCIPAKSNLYLDSSLETVIREPALYKFLTFHNPNLMSVLHRLGRLLLNKL
jgi:hypothetical protein